MENNFFTNRNRISAGHGNRFYLAALLLLSLLAITWQWRSGYDLVDSNVMTLLPVDQRDVVVQQAFAHMDEFTARQHVILVGAATWPEATAAATDLAAQLRAHTQFSEVMLQMEERQQADDAPPAARYGMLSRTLRERLQHGGTAALIEHATAVLYNPMAPISSKLLVEDPFFVYYDFLTSQLPRQGRITLRDNFLAVEKDNRFYVLIKLTLAFDPFSMAQQTAALTALDSARARVQNHLPAIEILDIGALRYAAAGVSSARDEVNLIGSASLIGVIAILLIVFRSPLPMIASLVASAIGYLAAIAVCWLWFGSIHIMTLVFGSSLLGISIDHCLHFFADRLQAGKDWRVEQGIRRIFPGITLGLATTIVGYAALVMTGFPVMQQMAIFSCVGLTGAYLTVIWLYPLWIKKPATADQTVWLKYSERLLHMLRPAGRRWPWLLCLPLAGILIAGIPQLRTNDDIRALQPPSAALKKVEEKMRAITGWNPALQYFLVEGDSAQAVLAHEESLTAKLTALQAQGVIDSFDAISNHLPSPARQNENIALLQTALADSAQMKNYSDATGFDETLLIHYREQVNAARTASADLPRWLNSDASEPWRQLWLGTTARGYASVITLNGVRDIAAVRALAAGAPHWHWMDKVSAISESLKSHRERGIDLTAAAYALVLLILMWRYGWLVGLGVMLPTALAAALTLAGLALYGEQLNLFHLLALLLVLGVGIDYSLFLMEDDDMSSSTMLAILLSALTNELAFGLLAVSATPAVHAFGITVFLGIASAALLAPLVVDFKKYKRTVKA